MDYRFEQSDGSWMEQFWSDDKRYFFRAMFNPRFGFLTFHVMGTEHVDGCMGRCDALNLGDDEAIYLYVGYKQGWLDSPRHTGPIDGYC